MQKNYHPISMLSAAIVVSSTLIGVGILTLPRDVTYATNTTDGWVSITLTGAMFILFGLLMAYIIRQFPGENIVQFGPKIWNRKLNTIICLLYLLFNAMLAGSQARAIADVLKVYLLDATPVEVIICFFLLVSTYTAYQGVDAIVRLNMIFFPIVIFAFLLILALNITNTELHLLRPFLGDGIVPILKGLPTSMYAFLGFGVMFFLAHFLHSPHKAPLSITLGIGAVTMFYVIATVISIATFNPYAITNILYPTVELAKEVEVPDAFFERFESVFITIWVMTVFNTTSITHYVVSLGISQIFKVKRRIWTIWPLPFFFLVAIMPKDIDQYRIYTNYLAYYGVLFITVLPLALFLAYKLKGGKQHEASK